MEEYLLKQDPWFRFFLCTRSSDDAQVLGPSGGPLTLFGPDYPCRRPFKRCRRFNITSLVVDVFIGEGNNLFAEKQLCCGYEEDLTIDLENIKLEYVHGELGSLAVRYIAMPLAVYGHVEVEFLYKLLDGENRSLNVKGKIVARYGNNSWTLFDKQNDNEFEQLENKQKMGKVGEARMRLSRCLVGVPVYSSLILDLDLSEFGTGRKFLKETIEFRVQNEVSQDQFLVDDDILIRVLVGWKSSSPQGRQELSDDDESSGDEMLSDDEQMDEEASCDLVASPSNRSLPWSLYPITACTLSFVEIFYVFIGRENYKPLQVYGSIKVAYDVCTFYVFKREAKEDAFGLSGHSKTLPLLDGSRVFNEGNSLEMKIDLKDVESQLHIKGYVCWDTRSLDSNFSPWLDKQLCSVIQGEHGGFAAIHYTIFSDEAEYADVKLLCIPKNGGHFCPKIYGSLVAQYNNYDYTSRYNRDYYRIVLFQRNRDDAAQPGSDGFITTV
ncbi:hypothetical protein CASFOL_040050 [Castilleja foliolosa]|uniref:DUF6598 domain-containing protein n=1 Tax=Castilleja foliolosa TaxID=1961234 RepID=A0ABD3BEC6_9LAMI